VTVSGDGSGGSLTASIVFSEASSPALDSRIYSLEQLSGVDSRNAAVGARISTDNLGLDGQAALINNFRLLLNGVGGPEVSPPDSNFLNFRPLYLGSMRVVGVQSRILWGQGNPGTSEDLRFEAQGYYWGPRSVLVDGGPQRPPTGLYPA